MGLDIRAYSKLMPVGLHIDPSVEWCENDDHIAAYAYTAFPRSFRGVSVLAQDGDFMHGGCFALTDETESMGFRAGSYGGYNRWRAMMIEAFNPDQYEDGLFYELTFFADNEGTIGPDAARDLLADFAAMGDQSAQFGSNWADFRAACALAADSGLVVFC